MGRATKHKHVVLRFTRHLTACTVQLQTRQSVLCSRQHKVMCAQCLGVQSWNCHPPCPGRQIEWPPDMEVRCDLSGHLCLSNKQSKTNSGHAWGCGGTGWRRGQFRLKATNTRWEQRDWASASHWYKAHARRRAAAMLNYPGRMRRTPECPNGVRCISVRQAGASGRRHAPLRFPSSQSQGDEVTYLG